MITIENFQKRIIGQDHIFETLCKYINIAEAGLSAPSEPKASFLFLGSTGTGKTETAKTMAELLNIPLIRMDMSEYARSHADRWLHDFAAKVADQTAGVILLDEIDKGEPTILDYFLQILSEAQLTVDGQRIDLSPFYIIMTSNLGSQELVDQPFANAQFLVELRAKQFFRPEFMGRFYPGCIMCFKSFDYATIYQVIELKLQQYVSRLANKGYLLTYTQDVIYYFVSIAAYCKDRGARPVVQSIQTDLSEALIAAAGKKNGCFNVSGGRIVFD